MALLSDVADVVAPDTPGYGASDRLRKPGDGLAPYVEWLAELLSALDLDKSALYGSATGAQIAIEFARAYPERLCGIVLDNLAHFEAAEREVIVRHYFPSLAPAENGAHLELLWRMCSGLYQWFPWYASDETRRVGGGVDAELIHATALEYLRAGEGYDHAYRAAFNNENVARLEGIVVPTKVIRWTGSLLYRQGMAFDEVSWPENIQLLQCKKTSAEERNDCIRRGVGGVLAERAL